MRSQRGLIGLMGLAALVGLGLLAKPAEARITTDQANNGSILVFPKVIADGTRDTIIQISNTSNITRHAHCFYVNGAPTVPGLPIGPNNPPLWTEIDFDIWLTKQQPTHWVVSTGRLDNLLDRTCRVATCDPADSGTPDADCCDAGFDPGRVPPVAPDFTGELKCIEVMGTGEPVGGNAFIGNATIEDPSTGDVSKYNAIAIHGFDNNNMDHILCLGGGVTEQCQSGAEYEACASTLILDHPSAGAPNPVVDQQSACTSPPCSSVITELTVVPCTQNFELQAPGEVKLQILVTNEFEETLSASTSFACWANFGLFGQGGAASSGGGGGALVLVDGKVQPISEIFDINTVGGEILRTTIRTVGGFPGGTGIMGVTEEINTQWIDSIGAPARNAQNAHTGFEDTGQNIITIPLGQIPPEF